MTKLAETNFETANSHFVKTLLENVAELIFFKVYASFVRLCFSNGCKHEQAGNAQ